MNADDNKYLETVRKNITNLSAIQDYLYQQCLEKYNIKDDDAWLFDYLYGNMDEIDKVERHVFDKNE